MIEVLPAVLPKDYEDMKNKIALVRGVVPMVQVDLCDGIFVPSKTWPFSSGGFDDYNFRKIINEEEGMPFWEEMEFELDMMVEDAVENFDIYTKLGPKRFIFHIEAMKDLESFKDFLEGIDLYTREVIEIGIAINPSTPNENLYPLVPHIDFVQCMGNDKIGFGGVDLDEEKIFTKIKILREKYPDLPIEVDIGVNEETAPKLVEAGATKLAAGSAIFNNDDIIGAVEKFRNL